jgi:hypothetical protein
MATGDVFNMTNWTHVSGATRVTLRCRDKNQTAVMLLLGYESRDGAQIDLTAAMARLGWVPAREPGVDSTPRTAKCLVIWRNRIVTAIMERGGSATRRELLNSLSETEPQRSQLDAALKRMVTLRLLARPRPGHYTLEKQEMKEIA